MYRQGLLAALLLLGGKLWSQGPSNAAYLDDTFVVVLDAGHGGHDPGNLGNGFLEKNIALNIVLEVGKALANDPNTKVIYTRDDDSFVDLYVRGEIANKAKADLFVSVHCDSHTSNAHGAGTFVLGLHANKQNFEIAKKENSVIYLEDNYESRYSEYDINSPESVIGLTIMQEEFLDQSILLGKFMQDRFTGKLKRNDRKVKQAGFIVLHQTFMPSVLVETGFLTNREEGTYLNSKKGQKEMGTAIADAIREYKKSVWVNDVPQAGGQVAVVEKEDTPETVVVNKPVEPKTVPEKKPVAEKQDPPKKEAVQVLAKTPVDTSQNPTATKRASEETATTKTKTETADKEKTIPTPAKTAEAASDLVFKVQLMAVSKDPDLNRADYRGLNKLSKEPVGGMFRILYGNTPSYEEAKLLKANADLKGYTTSYIVAYKNGKRIPLKEALQSLSN
ncbi:N-acetylmuramoyl-L-alanine amidase family protein [Robiginitalea sp. IMCC44478]|uniref:N-acetylmuramoyl-L-alanine amidase family protein n=1 Tax=Robiginitalea sp. IMCC44478 TaxID=3459122 RepID=UPI00404322F4